MSRLDRFMRLWILASNLVVVAICVWGFAAGQGAFWGVAGLAAASSFIIWWTHP